jgi:hypothetical protein
MFKSGKIRVGTLHGYRSVDKLALRDREEGKGGLKYLHKHLEVSESKGLKYWVTAFSRMRAPELHTLKILKLSLQM